MTTEPLTPTQADRDAAADVIGGWWRNLREDKCAAIVRDGMVDEMALVQAFARHAATARKEGMEKAAGIAEAAYDSPVCRIAHKKAARYIATAIREASHDQ